VGDDWLIDDVRGLKRKRPDMDSLFKDVNVHTERKWNSQLRTCGGRVSKPSHVEDVELRTPADREDRSFAELIFESGRTSPESTIMLNDEVPTAVREVPASVAALHRRKQTRLSRSGGIVPSVAERGSTVTTRADSAGQNVTSTTVIKPTPAPASNPLKMRLKVRIGDQLMLVPILERFASYFVMSE